MIPAPKINAEGPTISQPGFNAHDWMSATVPGTALTTMIDRGVYPDPDYGLNNLAIPETLNKQDYWYRVEFHAPTEARGRHLTLTFEGINYRAEVWLNGQSLGSIKGAFIRGVFDVTDVIKLDKTNVLAVRVSPPPHPGIPQEQSIKAGPGENGGIMCLDGPDLRRPPKAGIGFPQFAIAIPASGNRLRSPLRVPSKSKIAQVVTSLPLPDTSRADVEISSSAQERLKLARNRHVESFLRRYRSQTKQITLPPGESTVKLSAFRILTIDGAASAFVVAQWLWQAGPLHDFI